MDRNPFDGKIREILPQELVGMEIVDAESSRLMRDFAPQGMTYVHGCGRQGLIKTAPDGRIYGYLEVPLLERMMSVEMPESALIRSSWRYRLHIHDDGG